MKGKKKASLLCVVLLALSISAAPHTTILADRLANGTNDYVYVVADGGFGYEPGSREAISAAMHAGADIVVLHVRKDADGKIVTNGRTTLSQALATIGGKALVMLDGFEGFPQEALNACRRAHADIGLMFNTPRPLGKIRERALPEGLADDVVHGIYHREAFFVPTILAETGDFSAAPDIHFLRVAEVRVRDPNKLGALKRILGYESGTKLMLDTTDDDRCAGHGDAHAVAAPDRNWGWCLKQGARLIRTSHPAELRRYLEKCGRRDFLPHGPVVPYAAEAGARVSLTPVVIPAPREMTIGKGVVPAETKIETKRDAALPKEGYRLEVGPSGIEIAAADDDGEYWAYRTLEQLRGEINGAAYYPVVSIRDWPQFAWRGALLDDSRHFIGKEGVKTFIDGMSRHKMNVFHWHANDDQGWRIPIRGFPDLQKFGATLRRRDGSLYGPYFYTEEDVKEIVAYAKERHVKIVPEFEIPGHNRALICSYPEIGCKSSRPPKEHPKDGWCMDETVQANSICAGDDEAIRIVERMLDAFCELFPDSDTIHIGGDEVNPQWWRNCPKCQARREELRANRGGSLQSWLMRHFARYLADKGRRAIGWDEVAEGRIPENMSIMFWRGMYRKDQVAVSNHTEVVSCPSSHCYFDKDQLIPDDPFPSWASCRLSHAYSYDPCRDIAPECRRYVIGTEGLLWGEGIKSAKELIWKAYPRLCATAEIAWSYPPTPRDYNGFLRRLSTHIPRLRAWGIGSAHTQEMILEDKLK